MQNDIKSLDINYIPFHVPRSLINGYHGVNKSTDQQLSNSTHIVHRDYNTWGELFYDWSDLLILPLMFIGCIGLIYAVVYGWEYGWNWWQNKKGNMDDVEKCLNKSATNNDNNLNVVNANGAVDNELSDKINETWFAC